MSDFNVPEKRIWEYPDDFPVCDRVEHIKRVDRVVETNHAVTTYIINDVYSVTHSVYHHDDETTEYMYSYKSSTRQTKSLCIGGPMGGRVHTEHVAGKDYTVFNRAAGVRSISVPKTILVHNSFLPKGKQ